MKRKPAFYLKHITLCSMLLGSIVAHAQGSTNAPLTTVISDLVVTQSISGSNGVAQTVQSSKKFYRNSLGSTRVEDANQIVIIDNTLHKMIILDVQQKTGFQIDLTARQDSPAASSIQPLQDSNAGASPQDLGSRVISGVQVTGNLMIVAGATDGSPLITVETWTSSSLGLDVQTVVSNANSITSTVYTNIDTVSSVPDSLFLVPTGFQIR